MKVELNTTDFTIKKRLDNEARAIDFTEDFRNMAQSLIPVINAWNKTSCENDAVIISDTEAAQLLLSLATMLQQYANTAIASEPVAGRYTETI